MAQFTPTGPARWKGRYARIPGTTSVIHLRQTDAGWWPIIDWEVADETAHCHLLDGDDARALASAVDAAKHALTGRCGGAFLINEFGQVLVPANDYSGTQVALVGEWTGPLEFNNPFEAGSTFDLAGDDGMKCGDSWGRPYVGIPHNLSYGDDLYFKHVTARGTQILKPEVQDDALISALRSLRPTRPVRFIVIVGGLVATKVEVEPDEWQPHYVGRIDPNCWFDKD
jgi:hypothetical protein